jgi:DHA1 family bicyclomycin/chloramphenicol resistance-like MFS transporter
LSEALRLYGRLLTDSQFMPRVVALGFAYGAMFSYITGSSAVFIVGYGVSPQWFGLVFGVNSFGLIGSSQLNRLLLRRYSPRGILTSAYTLMVLSCVTLALLGGNRTGNFWLFSLVLFFCIALLGFIYPNGAAVSLAHLGSVAGTASALFGLCQFGIGSGGGAIVSMLHLASPLPMTVPMASFALVGYAILWLSPAHAPAGLQQAASSR